METKQKLDLFKRLNESRIVDIECFYEILGRCDALKTNYHDYMTTSPINVDKELLRLSTADYDMCCALLTMLLREDHFNNGSFERRQCSGQIRPIIEQIIEILEQEGEKRINSFSEKALGFLNGFYVYALVDPRDESVFYIGKGAGNRIFSHEIEYKKSDEIEKNKLKKIHEIENSGFLVKRLIINWGLSEEEAFVAEASLINLLKYLPNIHLINEVSGHHVHDCITVEEFEKIYGAIPLKEDDIRHSILVIKINKLYRKDMSAVELYDTVRGFWKASLNSIKERKVEYVFGVYNGLIVAVYKPDEWHYGYEMIDTPQRDIINTKDFDRLKNRVYFICKDYNTLDENAEFYLYKSIVNLKVNQSAQNPVTYLSPKVKNC